MHLLVQIGGEQQVLVLGEAVAERQDRVAEGVAAGDDAHKTRIFEAREVVPAPQGLQHTLDTLGLTPRVIEIEIDTKAIAVRARHSDPPDHC